MKRKFKHIEFDFSWFHLRLKNKKDIMEEIAEFFYLGYKVLGFVIGVEFILNPSLLWFIPFVLWLMIDLRMEKKETK